MYEFIFNYMYRSLYYITAEMAYSAWSNPLLLKETDPPWNKSSIYPKYIPKCSEGSTDYVCNFLPKNTALTQVDGLV